MSDTREHAAESRDGISATAHSQRSLNLKDYDTDALVVGRGEMLFAALTKLPKSKDIATVSTAST